MSSMRISSTGARAVILGLALLTTLLILPHSVWAAYQGLPPVWSEPDPFPANTTFLPDVNCNKPPPDQMPVIKTGFYWARLGERTTGRSVNRRDEFRINLKAGQLLRLHLYSEFGKLAVIVSRITTKKSGQKFRHIYFIKRCRDFPGYIAEIRFNPLFDDEYRVGVFNPGSGIKGIVERYLLEVEVVDNTNPPATHMCAGQPVPPPGVERKVSHAVEGWRAGNGRSEWSYSSESDLVRVWAHTYADVINQAAHHNLVEDEEETVKVVDYQTFEVTGVSGALYRCNISANLDLKGIVDRMDYTLPVGGSATKYHAELLFGLAETTLPRQIDTAPGARIRAWKVGNNIWEDLAWDIVFAVAAGGLSIMPGSSVAFTALGATVSTTLTVLPIIQDNIAADEYVSNRYRVNINNASLQAGKQYMVYALMIGRVRTVSTMAAAGMCELDFWYRAPYLCEDEGHDALGGRGFRLKDYQVTFAKTASDPPCTPMSPEPADGQRIIPMGGPLQVKWQGGDPDGEILFYDLYWGEVNPPPLFAGGLNKPQIEVLCQGDKTYYWRVVATDQKGNKTIGPLWQYNTSSLNHRPLLPQVLTPQNVKTDVPVNTRLAWRATDPDGDPLTYEVTLTRTNGATVFQTTTTDNSVALPAPLEPGAHYTWTVKASDGRGGEITATFSFATVNHPPAPPYSPQPSNQHTGVDHRLPMTCYVQDPEGDPLICDLYLGQASLPVAPTISGITPDADGKVTFTPTLLDNTTYRWKVTVRDNYARIKAGPIWTFTTGAD